MIGSLVCVALLLPYSTYLGGNNADQANAVAVDSQGNTYVVGETASTNFYFTNGFDNVMESSDAFITKFGTNGQVIFSTLLGASGSDGAYGVALDASSNVYVTGFTASGFGFPFTNGFKAAPGVAGSFGFVTKISANGSNLIYSSYFGGTGGDEAGHGIAVDSGSNAYVVGFTASTNFYVVNPIQATNHGGRDAFLVKVQPAGTGVVFSTYLGGTDEDIANAVAVDPSSNIYLAGTTQGSGFPVTNAIDNTFDGSYDGFVAKVAPAGTSLLWSTYYGGNSEEHLTCIALDAATNVYFGGYGQSFDIPLVNAIQTNFAGYVWDAYIAAIKPNATQYLFSTFYGGEATDYAFDIDVDDAGNILVAGGTESLGFPLLGGRPYGGGFSDGFVLKLLRGGQRVLFCTDLGGNASDFGRGIAAQHNGIIHVVGDTSAADFPVTNAFQSTYVSGGDAFITKIANEPVMLVTTGTTAGLIGGWNTYSGAVYQAQVSTNTVTGAWTDLGLPVTSLVGSCCMTVTQSPSATPRFLRARATFIGP